MPWRAQKNKDISIAELDGDAPKEGTLSPFSLIGQGDWET